MKSDTARIGDGEQEPPLVTPGCSLLQTRDFDQMAHAIRFLNADLRQIDAGPFQGEVQFVGVGAFLFLRTAVNRVVRVRGAARKDTYGLSLITGTNERATWRGRQLRPGEINVNNPSGGIDHLTACDYDSITMIVDVERLRSAGEVLQNIDIEERLRGIEAFHPDSVSFTALESALRSVIGQARSQSSLFESTRGRRVIEETCMRRLLEAIAGEPVRSDEVPVSNRQVLARKAEDFMLAHLHEPLLMTDLCEELEVSERALRYAFQERFHVSPLAYFKAQKLNAIRRQLKAVNREVSVQEVARQWGIVHVGNFAADYRRLFGELPSQTARAARVSVS